jgi:hypothetical protein
LRANRCMNSNSKESGTVYLLGAGASFGYNGSRTRVNPPLATTFFKTFNRLLISQDIEVKIGNIVNYVRDTRGISVETMASEFDENIESLFAELHRKLNAEVEQAERGVPPDRGSVNIYSLSRAYDQFIFWFVHVLNEVQNGEPCEIYRRLIEGASKEDTFITFNWDTILDRSLAATGKWYPDDGYGVLFNQIYERAWREPKKAKSNWKLIKLHGSTNWLGPYVTIDFRDGRRRWLSTKERVNYTWCIVDSSVRYDSYKDRWRPGYAPYSYFFPPDDPVAHTPLMPIIVPPTETKNFSEYGEILRPLWDAAHESLRNASRLVIVGYSFPDTDDHAFSLLEAFLDGNQAGKHIEIVDPFPDAVNERVSRAVHYRCPIRIHRGTLAEYCGLPPSDNSHSEYDEFTRPPKAAEVDLEDIRLAHMLYILEFCNLHGQPVDITTLGGDRYLDCEILGEWTTHLYCSYRDETYKYQVENIRIKPRDQPESRVSLYDIWLLNPMPREGFTEEQLRELDMSEADEHSPLLGCTLRESIRNGYHCKSEDEVDYFLRRYIGS